MAKGARVAASVWSTTIVITPGAQPISGRFDSASQLVILPLGHQAPNIRLDDDVAKELLVPAWEPLPRELEERGFYISNKSTRTRVAYVVVEKAANVASTLSALLDTVGRQKPERIWLPLMEKQWGDLGLAEDLGDILQAMARSGAARWKAQRFIIAVSTDIPAVELAGLRVQVERAAGRDILDINGAAARLGVMLDTDAEALLRRAGRLSWSLRPPYDDGRISTRLILFALLHLHDPDPPIGVESALLEALNPLATSWVAALGHYIANPNASAPTGSPVLFSPHVEEVLRQAAEDILRQAALVTDATDARIGVGGIAVALLQQAQRGHPNKSSARRALDRLEVSAAELLKGFLAHYDPRGPVPVSPPPIERKNYYSGFSSDIPNAKSDALHARAEAIALARVAALRDTPTPLAIGIFGDWGAGKSSFMETVHDVVAGDLEGREPYHTKIVQIRFNAWHYIETNLWASLVSHVFAELDRELRNDQEIGDSVDALHSGLATVRRSEVEQADRVIAAQARLDQALSVKPTKSGLDLVTLAGEAFKVFYDQLDPKDQDKIKKGICDLEIPKGGEAWQRAEKAARDAQSLANRARLAWGEMRRGWCAGDAAPIVWCVTLLGALILASLLGRAIAEGLGAVLGVFSGIGTAALTVAIALAKLPQAAGGVLGLFEQLDRRRKQADDMALAAIETEIAAARAALADAVTDFRAATPLGRLTRFIRDKAADEVYAKHLGLVAMIRKDFELLTACIVDAQSVAATAYQGGSTEEQSRIRAANDIAGTAGGESATPDAARLDTGLKPYGRIILYIDDLDRCTTEKVVEVLQAVHLLLAFKLFVVFVAVDYRWAALPLSGPTQGSFRCCPPKERRRRRARRTIWRRSSRYHTGCADLTEAQARTSCADSSQRLGRRETRQQHQGWVKRRNQCEEAIDPRPRPAPIRKRPLPRTTEQHRRNANPPTVESPTPNRASPRLANREPIRMALRLQSLSNPFRLPKTSRN